MVSTTSTHTQLWLMFSPQTLNVSGRNETRKSSLLHKPMNFWTDFKQALFETPRVLLWRERWPSFRRTQGSEDPLLGRSRGTQGAAVLMNRQRWKGQVPVMLMNGHYRAEMRGGKQHGGSSHEERLSFAPRISVNSFIMSEASPSPLLFPCPHLLLPCTPAYVSFLN